MGCWFKEGLYGCFYRYRDIKLKIVEMIWKVVFWVYVVLECWFYLSCFAGLVREGFFWGSDYCLLWGCFVYCGMWSSISGFYFRDVSSTLFFIFSLWWLKMVLDIVRCFLGSKIFLFRAEVLLLDNVYCIEF